MATPKPTLIDDVLVYPVKSVGCSGCVAELALADGYVPCLVLPPCSGKGTGSLVWMSGLEGAVKWAAQQPQEQQADGDVRK